MTRGRRRPRKLMVELQPRQGQLLLEPYLNEPGGQLLEALGATTEKSTFPGARGQTRPLPEIGLLAKEVVIPPDEKRLPVLLARITCPKHHIVGYIVEGGSYPVALYTASRVPDELLSSDDDVEGEPPRRSPEPTRHGIRVIRPDMVPVLASCPACREPHLQLDSATLLGELARRVVDIELSPVTLA